MTEKCAKGKAVFEALIGKDRGTGDWFEVKQDQINKFAEATGDYQWIHLDVERAAKESPYKVTIAHGFLTLSIMQNISKGAPPLDPNPYEGVGMSINYGLNKVRFPAPVKVNSKIRNRSVLVSVEEKGPDTLQLVYKNTIEVDGQEKPACVAESVSRVVYS